ncbi:phosphoribosylglycinamide formyltransferase [Amphritea sp. 2_MG-2023]|uniref:phosphoribosylglycinamide formyltransferase n=1 Tax=Amphritea TaxID=515417 RepID=UPI001C066799|nr:MULTISPECIES: phosphoribosylglycinamide formyltransferase [Amphritea]MBU2966305.1 phosphoribosylglycinamide formyltransferase [Amphritea atlantica]MDO6420244.1 phosphoribosylglycinamide formyltransferase [Amphritea sp. 2_MG-2023]
MTDKSIVVLISGSGSNLQAIIDAIASGQVAGRIAAVLSNKAEAFGLERAKTAGIPQIIINHKDYDSREDFDLAMIEAIDTYAPDLIVLAGFMRILTAEFVRHYQGRMLNIHPSLLPKYKGLHTHQRALDAGDAQHGCTVHFVTEELDGGPLAIQAPLNIHATDNADSLQLRVHRAEHDIYPLAVEWFCADRLSLSVSGAVQLDGTTLPPEGYQFIQE